MAKYIMQDLPDMDGKKSGKKYPRMLIEHQISLRELARTMAQNTTFSEGEVLAVVDMLADEIARRIADGYSVKVDRLGAFSAKLGLKEGVEEEVEGGSQRNASSIEITNVHFRPDKGLLDQANRHCDLQRGRSAKYNKPNMHREERLRLVADFLKRNAALTLDDYCALARLSRSTASRELRQFADEGLLESIGGRTHSAYILPKKRVEP